MEWLSIDEVAQFAATNDVIEFRQRNFGFIRKKHWVQVIGIDQDPNLSLVERIHVVELKNPKSMEVLSDGKTYSLAKLVDGKIGRFLNKKVQKTEKKRGIFDKIVSFFNRIIDAFQDFFHSIKTKAEEFHEQNMSNFGRKFVRCSCKLLRYLLEAAVGIAIVCAMIVFSFVILWWLGLAFASIATLIYPGATLMFPFSVVL